MSTTDGTSTAMIGISSPQTPFSLIPGGGLNIRLRELPSPGLRSDHQRGQCRRGVLSAIWILRDEGKVPARRGYLACVLAPKHSLEEQPSLRQAKSTSSSI